jgi:hypothetical protein
MYLNQYNTVLQVQVQVFLLLEDSSSTVSNNRPPYLSQEEQVLYMDMLLYCTVIAIRSTVVQYTVLQYCTCSRIRVVGQME